jgi:CRP/FNR family transcriptional regulator
MKEWIPAIAANRKTYLVKKGETIFHEGEELKGIFFVYEGIFKVQKKWDEEKELILRFAKKGDIIGHRGLGNDFLYPVTATAMEAGSVCFTDLAFFESSLKINYELVHMLLMFFAGELKESEKNMRNLAHMPVKGRIINALLQLHQKFGTNEAGQIDIPISRQELASVAGTTYETTFRILNELSSEKLVSISEKRISITDLPGLILLAT